jgi:hypothetical protein
MSLVCKPRLTVSVLTKNSEDRLQRLLSEVAVFADEIVVGVDAASTDGTFDLACAFADVVYRFSIPGQLAPARRLIFEYATGDWILSLDDDESIEDHFEANLPELLCNERITYVCFPRKWIIGLDPCRYIYEETWFPDWQLRLFRNDPRIVHKPALIHSGYWAQGAGYNDSRASILHFERLLCTEEERRQKLETYRAGGSTEINDAQYHVPANVTTRPGQLRTKRRERVPSRRAIDQSVRVLPPAGLPPWGSLIQNVDMASEVQPGARVIAEISVRNIGALTWTPHLGRFPSIHLTYHLLDASGQMMRWDNNRYSVPRTVVSGGDVLFIVIITAPEKPGHYLLEWDMVSEGECWFAACGSTTVRTRLTVHPARCNTD